MKNRNWLEFVKPLLMPAIWMGFGIILIVKPDSAAAVVGKLFAWLLVLGGTGMGLAALHGDFSGRLRRLIPAAVALMLGIWLMTNPLVIARSLGRLLGILLTLEAGGRIVGALRKKQCIPVMSVITLGAGVVLILVPMTTSRIVIVICGIAVLCIGAAELAERLLRQKRLRNGEKPRIIDEA